MKLLASIAALSTGVALNGPFTASGYGPAKPSFHPTINRWTGEPHKHEREIARHLKQRKAAQ